jgi:hypothetical protein
VSAYKAVCFWTKPGWPDRRIIRLLGDC